MTNAFSKLGGFAPRIYKDGQCYLNADLNKARAFKDLGLRVVYGSLGLGGWFEYGGKDWGVAEFRRKPTDSHAWLEDAEGNVYDYAHKSWSWIARTRGAPVRWQDDAEFFGEPKKDLARMGLTYLPASTEAQAVICAAAKQHIAIKRDAAAYFGQDLATMMAVL
jgi:hypothetical protein